MTNPHDGLPHPIDNDLFGKPSQVDHDQILHETVEDDGFDKPGAFDRDRLIKFDVPVKRSDEH